MDKSEVFSHMCKAGGEYLAGKGNRDKRKKTGGRKRQKKGIRGQLRIFVMSLSAVLMVGGTIMVGYAAFVAAQSAKQMQGNSYETFSRHPMFLTKCLRRTKDCIRRRLQRVKMCALWNAQTAGVSHSFLPEIFCWMMSTQ